VSDGVVTYENRCLDYVFTQASYCKFQGHYHLA